MKKKITSLALALGMLLSTGVVASATDFGSTASGVSGAGTSYYGSVSGGHNLNSCWGATTTTKNYGPEDVYAYVEIVNANGYLIGSGSANTGTNSAYSGTVTQRGGSNAYGSVGTASRTSSTFARLY